MTFKPIKYRGLNAYDPKEASDEAAAAHKHDPISLTVQSMTEDADINVLMRRMGVTGKMPENVRIPTYGDFSEITDYRGALEAVRAAHDAFMEIPAELRARFDNDPQRYMDWCADPASRPEMQKLGMLKAQPTPPPATGVPQPSGNPGTDQAAVPKT